MCGRFTLVTAPQELATFFELAGVPELRPSYNIAPSAVIPIIRARPAEGQNDNNTNPVREIAAAQWGLVPFWAKDSSIGTRMINARGETLAEKPAFRAAFRYRRCLVPADGFYEWKRKGGRSQPYHFRMNDNSPFAFAGLWECWEGCDGSALETCAIITTGAGRLMAPIHDRVPVILQPQDYSHWLNPKRQAPSALAALQNMLAPSDDLPMTCWPVSPHVNKPGHDTPECIHPVDTAPPGPDMSQNSFL